RNEGYICCLSSDMSVSKILKDMDYPNGLAFDHLNNILYISETGTKKIWRGIWDSKNMSLNENHLFAETGGSVGPDGLALDEVGNLYVAVYGGSSINVYN